MSTLAKTVAYGITGALSGFLALYLLNFGLMQWQHAQLARKFSPPISVEGKIKLQADPTGGRRS